MEFGDAIQLDGPVDAYNGTVFMYLDPTHGVVLFIPTASSGVYYPAGETTSIETRPEHVSKKVKWIRLDEA